MAENASTSKPCRIMLCDDAESFREVLRLTLGARLDIAVVGEAVNGRDAIEQVANLRPDLLLLDISMPVMTGLEALPHIRTASPDTAVFMVTGFAAEGVREEAFRLGAVEFLDKTEGLGPIADAIRKFTQN